MPVQNKRKSADGITMQIHGMTIAKVLSVAPTV